MSDLKVNWSLALSCASFLTSVTLGVINFRRDKERLQITVYVGPYEIQPPEMIITAVNSGRRPMVLVEFGIDYANGQTRTLQLNGEEGITLKEKERYIVKQPDLEEFLYIPDRNSRAKTIWFRDSLGKVRRAKKTAKKLRIFYRRLRHLANQTANHTVKPKSIHDKL